jgi:zinc transport system substrate-binding protein
MIFRLLLIFFTLAWASSVHAKDLQVVTSLKPVHSLTAAIMGETGTPTLLISGSASPHTFSLKPSHARALEKADLVVWIGAALERFLEAPLTNLASNALSLPLIEAEGISLLDARTGGIWSGQEDNDHHDHADHDEHDGEALDPHIWLDLSNAIAMTRAIETALNEVYPEQAAIFSENAKALRAQLRKLDQDIEALTQPVTNRPYFVFHDAYQYFEKYYGLTPLGAVTASPDIRPGARRLTDLREVGDAQSRICVFAEPQFEPRLLNILTERENATLAYLDPLGSDIPAGPEQYEKTMRALVDNLVTCLQGQP